MAGNVDVRPIPKEDMAQVKDWMLNHHYIRGWPKAVQAVLGVYVDGKLSGGLLYGIGTRAQSAREIFQNDDKTPIMQNNQMWELQRAFTTDEAKTQVQNLGSMVISRGNEFIRQHAKTKDGKPVKAVISYADSVAGHKGSVYQSTNALYLGEQKPLPFYTVTNPQTGNYVRKSALTPQAKKVLTDKGFVIEKHLPETGKHKFVYPLGKDQRERDMMTAKIVRPLYSYPKEGVPPQEIPNQAREKSKQQPPQKSQQQSQGAESKNAIIKKLLNSKVKNPDTGNDILVRTALKYDKNHPSYKQAMGMTQAYAKRFGIKLRPR